MTSNRNDLGGNGYLQLGLLRRSDGDHSLSLEGLQAAEVIVGQVGRREGRLKKTSFNLKGWILESACQRICSVVHVVRHVEQLLGAALDEAVQRGLHQLQVLQLPLEPAPGPPQKPADGVLSSVETNGPGGSDSSSLTNNIDMTAESSSRLAVQTCGRGLHPSTNTFPGSAHIQDILTGLRSWAKETRRPSLFGSMEQMDVFTHVHLILLADSFWTRLIPPRTFVTS